MYEKQRGQMVHQWVKGAGIRDQRVIAAFRKVPRHLFVDPAMRNQAYAGKSLPIGYGQTISHPGTVALMTALLELSGREKVLEVGTGSGYQTALLAELCDRVFSIERIPQLAQKARRVLERLGYYRVAIMVGDGSLGWPSQAPFDRILVTAGTPQVPVPLRDQLAEGGRLLVPVGPTHQQKLKTIDRINDRFIETELEVFQFVPLIGKKGWPL